LEYFLNEQQKTVKSLARRIAEEKILPVRAELDEKEEFPWAIIKNLADADMFRVFIPEEYDGLGGGCLELCLVMEELSRVCSGVAISYAASALGSFLLLEYGSEEQKRKYLPDIASGKRLTAFALTESTAGTDVSGIRTTAERERGGYVINGTKQFITNGGEAEIYEESAMAKVFASDTAMKVTTDAVQIFGGVGYMKDYPVEKMMRDAKITQIYEGTNQALRTAIALQLRKRKGMQE